MALEGRQYSWEEEGKRDTDPPSRKYPRWKVSGRETAFFSAKKWASECDTTDTARGVSNIGRVERLEWCRGPRARRRKPRGLLAQVPGLALASPGEKASTPEKASIQGGVPVSTGWQEVQIACRGWSAGHVKSRPSFNCRSSVFSGCLTKQPRAMAPVGRASQSVAKSDSPRFTAWYGRG